MSDHQNDSVPLAIGTDLPAALRARYRVECELGRGSMGVVYRALDLRLSRFVAIKELHPTAVKPDSASRVASRFLREAQLAARLSHPNIVTVFDIIEEEDRWFLVMELLEGQSLRAVLAEADRPLPFEDVRRWVLQAASALASAHRAEVIHRDIKPENLIILTDQRLKIMDFGIALSMSAPRLTGMGATMGTPAYLAPEVLDGRHPDSRSDLFALGVVMYEMIAGKNPYAGTSITDTLIKIVSGPPPSLRSARPEVPEDLVSISQRLLALDPDHRYASTEDLVQALEGASVSAVPGSGGLEQAHWGEESAPIWVDPGEVLEEHPTFSGVAGPGRRREVGPEGAVPGKTGATAGIFRRSALKSVSMGVAAVAGLLLVWVMARSGEIPGRHAFARAPLQVPFSRLTAGDPPTAGPLEASRSRGAFESRTQDVLGSDRALTPPSTPPASQAAIVSAAQPAQPLVVLVDGGGESAARARAAAGVAAAVPARSRPASSVHRVQAKREPTPNPGSQKVESAAQKVAESAVCGSRKAPHEQMLCLEQSLVPVPKGAFVPRESQRLLFSLLEEESTRERALAIATQVLPRKSLIIQMRKWLAMEDSGHRWAAAETLAALNQPVPEGELRRLDLTDRNCPVRNEAALYFVEHPLPAVRSDLEKALKRSVSLDVEEKKNKVLPFLKRKKETARYHCDHEALTQALAKLPE